MLCDIAALADIRVLFILFVLIFGFYYGRISGDIQIKYKRNRGHENALIKN